MLVYNALTTLLLISVGIGSVWVGPLLWPAALLHGMLSILLARQMMIRRGDSPAAKDASLQ